MKILSRILFALALVVLVACDSNDAADEPENILGSFELEVTGAVTQNVNGNQAAFGAATNQQAGASGFGLTLGATTGTSASSLSFTRRGNRPGEGAHTIPSIDLTTDFNSLGEDDFVAIYSNGTDVFYATGGTLTITESTDRRMEGSISMTASNVNPQAMGEVTITGNFVALGLDITTN